VQTQPTTDSTDRVDRLVPVPHAAAPRDPRQDHGRSAFTVDFADASPHGDVEVRYALDPVANVWVASFINQKVTELCGRVVANCPPGAKTGDPISPSVDGYTNGGLQHVTAVQVDASGNVWAANNWQTVAPIVGGNGLVEYIGAAAPVRTPLIGAPERPR